MTKTLPDLKHWQFSIDFDNIAWAIFDQEGASTNTFSTETGLELEKIVATTEEAAKKGEVRALIFLSGKEKTFIVGADIREFEALTSEKAVKDVVQKMTGIFDRLERLPIPVICGIHGYCLGGGLEFAMACHYRIATRDDATRIGLPEVKLGIIPGLHGTVRMTKLAGAIAGMGAMLTGRMLRPGAARVMGLVDQLAPGRQELRWACRKAAINRRRTKKPSLWKRAQALPGIRSLLASRMRKATAAKVREDHYPAPFRLIELFEQHGGNREAMAEAETQVFAPLMISDTSRNLRRVFHLSELLKNEAPKDVAKPLRAHIIGAGTMGGDIAAVCVASGMEVSIQDTSAKAIDKALGRAKQHFKKRLRSKAEVNKAVARLHPDTSGHFLRRADVVIEAIVEKLEIKQQLFKSMELVVRPSAILATNTSSLRIDDIAAEMNDPTRLIGLHFFNPVPQMPLVEVVRGEKSREDEVRRGCAFVTAIGKFPLITKDTPGFLVNAVLSPYLFGAIKRLDAGEDPAKIDAAAEKFGMPMGPIELADAVGLDICKYVAEILGYEVPENSKLAKLVKEDKLGKKSNQGFYTWLKGKAQKNVAVKSDPPSEEQSASELEALGRELIVPLIDACEKALADGVVADADHVDAGVIFGTGFAPFRGGPLHYRASLNNKTTSSQNSPEDMGESAATVAE
ncbi:MAG: 3-hydroxyacyl-CoA dehydrogenase NAD-binding domain-containing protein [Alphaproteobacteria bacterium]